MQRELSSKASFLHRVVVPIFLTGGAVFALWQISAFVNTGMEKYLAVFFMVAIPGSMTALAWYLSRAKRVWIENDDMIVAGFFDTIRFPLKDINKVTATRFQNPEQVKIYFRSPSGANGVIFFYPPMRLFKLWSHHPIAEEIRQLAHGKESPDTPYLEKKQSTDWKRVLLGVAGFAVFGLVLVGTVTAMIKTSEPYQWSLGQVRGNPSIENRLGSPITPGWFVSGSISTGSDSGAANIKYSVSGPEGKGIVLVEGKMINNDWVYTRGGIEIESDYVSFLSSHEDRN